MLQLMHIMLIEDFDEDDELRHCQGEVDDILDDELLDLGR
jgi:hypothetical protein